jgi:hypothetical protein
MKFRLNSASKDLIILAFVAGAIFILSYFFSVFTFLTEFFQKYPKAITWVDEVITALLTLSFGFAVFSWRRWIELKNESSQRIKLQEELLRIAETKAETEKIICRQLHCDIEEYKKIEKDILSRRPKKQ